MDSLSRIDDDPIRTLRAELSEAEAEYYDALSYWFERRKGAVERLAVAEEWRRRVTDELAALQDAEIPF